MASLERMAVRPSTCNRHGIRVVGFRQDMCAFLSSPYQTNLCHLQKRILVRARSLSGRHGAGRRLDHDFGSRRILPLLDRNPFQMGFFIGSERSNPRPSSYLTRSLPNEDLFEIAAIGMPQPSRFQPEELLNLVFFLTDRVKDLHTPDPLTITFIATILAGTAAAVLRKRKGRGEENSAPSSVEKTQQQGPKDDSRLVENMQGSGATSAISSRTVMENDHTGRGEGNSVSSAVEKPQEQGTKDDSRLVENIQGSGAISAISSGMVVENDLAGRAEEWLNNSKVSPFNRTVAARCPSLYVGNSVVSKGAFEKPEYQRRCIPADDGGTIALDWPSRLDLDANEELQTNMLIICGTVEGSQERGIEKFSRLVEQRGYFPIIFNPRGCGGSPLTTPRMFSAADSDDVRLAVNFIAKSRPWTTTLSVGWGLGASILAKYLGEEDSSTPLTAAVCVDNPFDLNEAAKPKSNSRWTDFDRALTKGLVQILRSNKMLFRGGKKRFDVSRAMKATSLPDFDSSISRVVHEYETVEDFYRNVSSGASLERVQIPLLSIQHTEDYNGTQIPIPRHVFETNPYTMLLVSQAPSGSGRDRPGAASEETHFISLEWLAAVEISLLKGRHPLSRDFDSVILPPKEPISAERNQLPGLSPGTEVPQLSATKDARRPTSTKAETDELIQSGAGRSLSPSEAGEQKQDAKKDGTTIGEKRGFEEEWQNLEGKSSGEDQKVVKEDATLVSKGETSAKENGPVATQVHGDGNGTAATSGEQRRNFEHEPSKREQKAGSSDGSARVDGTVVAKAQSSEELETGEATKDAKRQLPEKSQKEGSSEGAVPSSSKSDGGQPNESKGSGSKGEEQAVEPQGEEVLTEEEQAERGQVLQVAETVMKFLDVTMPGVLPQAKKEQVLKNVERGETLVTSLEGAVPEDVRGKMSGVVSEVVQGHGFTDKLPQLGKSISSLKMPEGMAEKFSNFTAKNDASQVPSPPVTQSVSKDIKDTGPQPGSKDLKDEKSKGSPASNDAGSDAGGAGGSGSDSKGQAGQADAGSTGSTGGDSTPSSDGASSKQDSTAPSKQTSQTSDSNGAASTAPPPPSPTSGDDSTSKATPPAPSSSSSADASSSPPSPATQPQNANSPPSSPSPGAPAPQTANAPPPPQNSAPQSGSPAPPPGAPAPPVPPPPPQNSTPQSGSPAPPPGAPAPPAPPPPPQNSTPQSGSPAPPPGAPAPPAPPASPPPAPAPPAPAPAAPPPPGPPPPNPAAQMPSMGDALQALTGFDDSTQMAVTNVFGVVEGVLDQMEEDKNPVDPNATDPESRQKAIDHTEGEVQKKLESCTSGNDEEDEAEQGDEKGGSEAPTGRTEESHQSPESIKEKTQDNSGPKMKSPRSDVERSNSGENGTAFGNGTARPSLGKNDKGYIKEEDSNKGQKIVASEKQDGPKRNEAKGPASEEQDGPKKDEAEGPASEKQDGPKKDEAKGGQSFPQSTSSITGSSSNGAQKSATTPPSSGEQIDETASSESAHEMRLRAMEAELETQGDDKTSHASPTEQQQVTTENSPDDKDKGGSMVANIVTNALQLEVVRRLGGAGLGALGVDVELELTKVAQAVSEAVGSGKEGALGDVSNALKTSEVAEGTEGKIGSLNSSSVINALNSVLGSNSVLGTLLPVGILAGVVMAALGTVYLIVTDDEEKETAQVKGEDDHPHVKRSAAGVEVGERDHAVDGKGSVDENPDGEDPTRDSRMMGTMAAAVGTTAAVASQTSGHAGSQPPRTVKDEEKVVPNLAARAASIVSPVVPKTEQGEVDQERIVTMLTEIGQRGGPLLLVGKAALLWGGLRGAMSLADRLLSFLHMAERPLYQRLLGFGVMSLLLWTPVLVPLLPSLVGQWATHAPGGVADAAAGIGLYGAVFIMITLWGKRIRGYKRPLFAYGLELFSRAKLRLFAGGMAIGLSMVSAYYGVNWGLGYAHIKWDSIVVENPVFPGALASTVQTSWKLLTMVGQSFTMSVAVSLVEEVLFRAWLQEEICADLGYDWAVLLSALGFALVHWSPQAIVGLWFLGVALAGARARTEGHLTLPVGIHTGIVASFSVMNTAGLVQFLPDAPAWFTGAQVGNPLAGALGTGMAAALAIALYPRQPYRLPEDAYDDGGPDADESITSPPPPEDSSSPQEWSSSQQEQPESSLQEDSERLPQEKI